MRHLVVLVALVLVVAPLCRAMELAAHDEVAFLSPDANVRELSISRARALGVTYIRQMVWWHLLHSCRGADALAYLGQLRDMVVTAQRHGIRVQLVVAGVAASWGVPRGCHAPYTTPTGVKPNVAHYKTFVSNIVQFFNKLGVKRFSLWNEPNLASFLCSTTTSSSSNVDSVKCKSSKAALAKLFVTLYKAGYGVIQSLKKSGKVSKDTRILFGELAGFDPSFVDLALKGQKIKADGFSYHPYQYCSNPTTKKKVFPVKTCHRLMHGTSWIPDAKSALSRWHKSGVLRTPGGGVVPLYLTEFGYHVQGPNRMPENIRSKWYPQALEFARKLGVKGFVLYQFQPSPVKTPPLWDTSILDGALNPKPSYRAIWNWAKSRKYKVQPV